MKLTIEEYRAGRHARYMEMLRSDLLWIEAEALCDRLWALYMTELVRYARYRVATGKFRRFDFTRAERIRRLRDRAMNRLQRRKK